MSDLGLDVSEKINAVRCQVGERVLEAGAARVVTLSRSYAADPDDVWDACTNPERIPRCDPPRGFDATWESAATPAGSSCG